MADPIISLRSWSRVAELKTSTVELALLRLAAARPFPALPLNDTEQREAILLIALLRERDYVRRALALLDQLVGVDPADLKDGPGSATSRS